MFNPRKWREIRREEYKILKQLVYELQLRKKLVEKVNSKELVLFSFNKALPTPKIRKAKNNIANRLL